MSPFKLAFVLAVYPLAAATVASAAIPFTLQGPGVNPANFRVTVFANGLSYPLGMAELSDGSLLVAVSDGPDYFGSNGRLLRLNDTNRDGVSDGAIPVLFTGMSGGLTSVRVGGSLVFVTGQSKPIYVLRMGATPTTPFTQVGRIDITYPAGSWEHPHSALGVRPTPGRPQAYDLFFQLGSKANFATTAAGTTATISGTGIPGVSGTLSGDSIYRLTLLDSGSSVAASNLTQVANGLRNPAGFAFHPTTGDFYFEDNGIDGLSNPNEPLSADELNVIAASNLGVPPVAFFGFPTNYMEYRTGRIVGGAGIQPLVAFQPKPDPLTGEESEGPNDLAFAPPAFPDGLNDGIFIGFHGIFNSGGPNNEENALVYVDLTATNYFHFIPSKLPGVGHFDGLLTTQDSLFIADLSTTGNLNNNAGSGVIYQIKSLAGPAVHFRWIDQNVELTWAHGMLQTASDVKGNWTDVTNAPGPYLVASSVSSQFFRTKN